MKNRNIWRNIFNGKMPPPASTSGEATSHFADDKTKPESSEVRNNNILCSSTSRYLIQEVIGEGTFGKVTKAVNLITSKDVALKILKTEDTTKREIKMLNVVSILDPVKKSVVQFLETFDHEGQTCLVFEKLDKSLFALLSERQGMPLSLSEIRPITHQLLTAFDALKGIGVIHSDLKPDNIMLANHLCEPFRVKLIDFGVSFQTSEDTRGITIQPLGYRAPEVILGLPISEAIDMWGLGCVLAFLYLGRHLFADSEYQSMKGIVDMLGQPADHLLSAGYYTQKFFKKNQHWDKPIWWMKTPIEYLLGTGIEPKRWLSPLRYLDDLIMHYPDMEEAELEDQRAFVSLLNCLLHTDSEERITPGKALTHPFVTMVHLGDETDTSSYIEESFENMTMLPVDHLDEELCPDGEAKEQLKVGEPSVKPPSVAPSCVSLVSVKIVLHSADGQEAAAVIDTTVSDVDAASPAEESPDEDPPAKVKKSRMRRIFNFFGRKIRTLFGLKKGE
uniref:Protein kinase domain-containing protein n=2 Tax=Lates calcarifer TaxID=8187 RepID=A0A4W6G708_LATCA